MALTEAQRVSIRFYLGWSARFHQFDSRLEQAMNAVDTLPDTETLVESILSDLDDIASRLSGCYTRLKALKAGSVTLPGTNEVAMLRSEGRRYSGQLAATLGVEVRHDAWGASRHRAFASHYGLVSSAGGNYYPHG